MYDIILTEPADGDVDEILTWLEKRSQREANSWLASYRHAIKVTRKQPTSFGLAPESTDCPEDIH